MENRPEDIRMKILAAADSGCTGIYNYPGEGIDGLYFLAIDRAMAEIACLEDYYTRGERKEEVVTLLEPTKNRYLMKDAGDPVWSLSELEEGLVYEVGPSDVGFVLIREYQGSN